jgi:hypothetical protein
VRSKLLRPPLERVEHLEPQVALADRHGESCKGKIDFSIANMDNRVI